MTEKERIESNKLIAEFIGAYPDSYGRWYLRDRSSTHPYYIGDTEKEFKYHLSWDWQIPAWGKVIKLLNKIQETTGQDFTYLKLDYSHAIEDNKPENGLVVLIEAIKFYNSQNL